MFHYTVSLPWLFTKHFSKCCCCLVAGLLSDLMWTSFGKPHLKPHFYRSHTDTLVVVCGWNTWWLNFWTPRGWLVCMHSEACLYARTHTYTHTLPCQFHLSTKANNTIKHKLVQCVCLCVHMWHHMLVYMATTWAQRNVECEDTISRTKRGIHAWVCECMCVILLITLRWFTTLPRPPRAMACRCVCVWSSCNTLNQQQMLRWPPCGRCMLFLLCVCKSVRERDLYEGGRGYCDWKPGR